MTDPTRAEVAEYAIKVITGNIKPLVHLRKEEADALAASIQALRERAEAAEKERDEALNQLDSAKHSVDVLCRRITTTNAAWNDAIEAAAKACLTSPAGEWGSAGAAASRIRALRLATPTEGEA